MHQWRQQHSLTGGYCSPRRRKCYRTNLRYTWPIFIFTPTLHFGLYILIVKPENALKNLQLFTIFITLSTFEVLVTVEFMMSFGSRLFPVLNFLFWPSCSCCSRWFVLPYSCDQSLVWSDASWKLLIKLPTDTTLKMLIAQHSTLKEQLLTPR